MAVLHLLDVEDAVEVIQFFQQLHQQVVVMEEDLVKLLLKMEHKAVVEVQVVEVEVLYHHHKQQVELGTIHQLALLKVTMVEQEWYQVLEEVEVVVVRPLLVQMGTPIQVIQVMVELVLQHLLMRHL